MPTAPATTQLAENAPSKLEEGRISEAGASGNYLLFNRQQGAAEAGVVRPRIGIVIAPH